MARFSNKVAIITGSSNGIGRATALLLAVDGAQVTITGRNSERLEESRQQLLAAGVKQDNIHSIVADLTTAKGQDQLINSTIQRFGKLDILINNAAGGINDPTGVNGLRQSIETYQKNFDLNLKSVVELTQKARPHLEKTRGDIVNVSSIASGSQACSSFTYYSMAKAALDQFTRNSAVELIESGIRMNCVKPGCVSTGFLQAMGAPNEVSQKIYNFMEADKHCIPTRKVGTPEEIAHLIAFLADRQVSSYIIGQIITADGGSSLISAINSHDFLDMLK